MFLFLYSPNQGCRYFIVLEFQTLAPDSLNLTEVEISDIISFMKSLTDEAYLNGE